MCCMLRNVRPQALISEAALRRRGDIQLAIYTIYKYRVRATPVKLPQCREQSLRYPSRTRAQADIVDKADVRPILIVEVTDEHMVRRVGLLRPLAGG
ncbi:hypothetical protein CP532_6782 [Ophiocordyceps camponoti-leonardi (nom. inval.)]|nr:hypothetical protein CP532_6782 [Ophiocordyceps camponoti-leonardi (nom. inval.)]